jgi:uncharacterized protein YukE
MRLGPTTGLTGWGADLLTGLDRLEQLDHSAQDVTNTAEKLRRTAAAASDIAQVAGRSQPSEWYGQAAQASRGSAAILAARLVEVFDVLDAAARLLEQHALRVRDTRYQIGRIREAYEQLEIHSAAWAAADPATRPAVDQGLTERWHLERAWLTAWVAHEEAQHRLSQALDNLRDGVSRRPYTTHDHVAALANGIIVEPLEGLFALGPQVFVDQRSWRAAWAATAKAALDAVRHPATTTHRMLGIDDWRRGNYGAAAAVWISGLTGAARKQLLGAWNGPASPPERLMDPFTPQPPRQTLQEMYDGVDLRRHDDVPLGHIHSEQMVDMNEDYLEFRLRTPRPSLTVGTIPPPRTVSAFDDLDTANWVVTQAIRQNIEDVKAFEETADAGRPLRLPALRLDKPVGRIATLGDAGVTYSPADHVVVIVRKDARGVFVQTALLETR